MKDMFTTEYTNTVIGLVPIQANCTRILSVSEFVKTVLDAKGTDWEGVDAELCGTASAEKSANKVDA